MCIASSPVAVWPMTAAIGILPRGKFLVPTRPLAVLVRAKMRAALQKRRPDLVLPRAAWSKPWVIHCTAWGDGAEAVLRYLARYVFRVAIAEARIVGLDHTGVSIRHKHRKSARRRTTRLDGHEFMRRFLQHVLPKGLHKVRYSGLWHASRRDHATSARDMLALAPTTSAGPRQDAPDPDVSAGPHRAASPCPQARLCPCCKAGHLEHVRKLYPRQVRGP